MASAATAMQTLSGRLATALARVQQTLQQGIGNTVVKFVASVEAAINRTPDAATTFFPTDGLPWVRHLEANWTRIRAELDQIMPQVDLLPNFVDISPVEVGGDGWKVFFFRAYGIEVAENCRRCPETTRLLATIPGLTNAMFSVLKAGRRLPAHRGPYNGILRYHLGLIVPAGQCAIRVGGDVRYWQEGRSLLFDDGKDHEAWNDSDRDRVVLFVDVLRPLPFPLALANRLVIELIRHSDWIRMGRARWAGWEARFGEEIDKLLAVKRAAR